jgi:hypothetical protein
MKVLLVQADGKLPNLALMKLSTWHKSQGDTIGFNVSDPDRIYVSIVFKKNKQNHLGIPRLYSDAEVFYGGPGHDLETELPSEIEFSMPDYSLYPKMDFSMGFTTRGCIRNCYFCIVPEKEGPLTIWQHPREFHNPAFKTIMLMDNNWLADKEWFMETSQWILDNDLRVWEHGMDIRLLDNDIVSRLASLKWAKPLHFAFDSDDLAGAVENGINLLNQGGVDVRGKVRILVYMDNSSPEEFDSVLTRCRLLKKWGATPLVMFNIDRKPTKTVNHLRRWTGRPWLFWKFDFAEYNKKCKVDLQLEQLPQVGV